MKTETVKMHIHLISKSSVMHDAALLHTNVHPPTLTIMFPATTGEEYKQQVKPTFSRNGVWFSSVHGAHQDTMVSTRDRV